MQLPDCSASQKVSRLLPQQSAIFSTYTTLGIFGHIHNLMLSACWCIMHIRNALCVIEADLAWAWNSTPLQTTHTQNPRYGMFAGWDSRHHCITTPPMCQSASHNIQNRPSTRQKLWCVWPDNTITHFIALFLDILRTCFFFFPFPLRKGELKCMVCFEAIFQGSQLSIVFHQGMSLFEGCSTVPFNKNGSSVILNGQFSFSFRYPALI